MPPWASQCSWRRVQVLTRQVVIRSSNGYLTRRPDSQDRRTRIIEFSDRGWAAIGAALVAFEEIERGIEAELGAARVKALRRTLEMLVG